MKRVVKFLFGPVLDAAVWILIAVTFALSTQQFLEGKYWNGALSAAMAGALLAMVLLDWRRKRDQRLRDSGPQGKVLFLGELQKLKLERGDALVLRMDRVLTQQQRTQLHHLVNTQLGSERRVLILDGGVKVGVLGGGGK